MTPELRKIIDDAKVKTERLLVTTELDNASRMIDQEIDEVETKLADMRRLRDALWKIREYVKRTPPERSEER